MLRAIQALAVLATLATTLAPTPAAGQDAAPSDVESIDAIITALYDVISGEAGEARDWDRFRSLFAAQATLSPVGRNQSGEVQRRVMTPDAYVEQSAPFLEENGFVEAEIGRVTERYGLIAHAFSAYESYRSASDEAPFTRGINSIQLMYDGERWYVVSVFWQGESPDYPIPAQYIGDIG
ncbi:MAG: hypothetical protein HKN72_04185 [Gemmatimonadetes bacterium]|nr:hypothetical protein [Gemmatimonadota bacterium]NNF12393.1 hypothetical protein [Gemmatimonadota bacterium]